MKIWWCKKCNTGVIVKHQITRTTTDEKNLILEDSIWFECMCCDNKSDNLSEIGYYSEIHK